jgi:hypothetical protein
MIDWMIDRVVLLLLFLVLLLLLPRYFWPCGELSVIVILVHGQSE